MSIAAFRRLLPLFAAFFLNIYSRKWLKTKCGCKNTY
jgi:hypothetical protein